ncbi:MAG: hypothetical protein P4L43_07345 [Syntrophobacteraceae bacterium]|nr:hypothetical protein [Syntrophobacteraceae bacterium]
MATPKMSQVAVIQGLYLFIMAVWPLASMQSFLRVTGPKADLWLVITVGLLLAIIGAVLISAGFCNRTQYEFAFLGFGTAASLAAIDIYFSIKATISAVYLLDALIEVGFVVLWLWSAVGRKTKVYHN